MRAQTSDHYGMLQQERARSAEFVIAIGNVGWFSLRLIYDRGSALSNGPLSRNSSGWPMNSFGTER